MTVRVVEGKQPYTWGTAIEIDENKVISLRLRDENNLIIYDAGDNEIYVDLQLPDELTPTDAFPVWITTGRVIVDNGWDLQWTLICAKTTSGDNIKLLYADEWTLWIDNWTWTFKQIYFKADVDGIITTLTTYIDWELAKKQNWVTSATAPSNPSEWDLWYDTTSNTLKVYNWSSWTSTWWGWGWGSDIEYVTQAEYNALLPWAASDWKHYFIYTSSVTPTDRPDITNATSDNKSVVVTATWELQWFCLSTDWLNLYYSDYAWRTINQYSLSTAWDISTATDSSKLFNIWEEVSWVFINNSWNKMFLAIGGFWIREYTLSTPYDVSTASLTNTLSSGSNLTWIWISSDWTKLYYMNYSDSKIIEYLLPTAWSLTWAVLVWDISYPVSWTTYRDCAVSPLNKVYLVRQQSTSTIYQMDMATSQNITTATYNNVDLSLSFGACWIYIKPDGSKMYIGDISNKIIYQYSL